MSIRPVQPDAGARSSRHRAVLSAGLFRYNAIASTGAEYKRFPMPKGTLVNSSLKGSEIVVVVIEALKASREMIDGKPIGLDTALIFVKSKEGSNVTFSITIHIEHGGTKVIMRGNVGGQFLNQKLDRASKASDDSIAFRTAELYKIAGGTDDGELEIEFTEKILDSEY